MTLELALAGVPMVAAYRTGAMEAFILRRAIRVNSVILANLVIGENVVPEFLQENCRSERLLPALRDVLGDTAAAAQADRGLRPHRCHHVDRRPAAERARRRNRAGDDAESARAGLEHDPESGNRFSQRQTRSVCAEVVLNKN